MGSSIELSVMGEAGWVACKCFVLEGRNGFFWFNPFGLCAVRQKRWGWQGTEFSGVLTGGIPGELDERISDVWDAMN